MTPDTCYSLICTIYTTFQRACPSRQSPVFENLFTRLADIPDEHASGIRENIEQLDSLPQNLGKAILGAWETYKMEHGIRQQRRYCPTCQNDGGWMTIRRTPDGPLAYRYAFAPCPACGVPISEQPLLSRKQLEESGAIIVPPNYPGGWLKFLADKGFKPPMDAERFKEHLPLDKQELLGLVKHAAPSRVRYEDSPF